MSEIVVVGGGSLVGEALPVRYDSLVAWGVSCRSR